MMRAGRWNEILQDVAKKGIHVAFIQGVRQAEIQGRGARREWNVVLGKKEYHIITYFFLQWLKLHYYFSNNSSYKE